MDIFELVAWINFLLLNVSGVLSFFFYTLSVMPVKREKKVGVRAWQDCITLRILAESFWVVLIISIILWIWFPISILNWIISNNYIILIIISIFIGVPSIVILVFAIKDAGEETIKTSINTKMYTGIYGHIRHPQILGTVILLLMACLLLNSLFLLIWLMILMVMIIPIVIFYEEKDLIERFGEVYIKYKRTTGVLIPKFWKPRNRY